MIPRYLGLKYPALIGSKHISSDGEIAEICGFLPRGRGWQVRYTSSWLINFSYSRTSWSKFKRKFAPMQDDGGEA